MSHDENGSHVLHNIQDAGFEESFQPSICNKQTAGAKQ
jgi:hypothetical protein